MTLVSSIIQDAYREGNLIPVGKDPTDAEQAEGLRRLNTYVKGVFGFTVGEGLDDWPVPSGQRTAPVAANFPQFPYPQSLDAGFYANPLSTDAAQQIFELPPKNSRIVFGGSDGQTVYFPEAPDDGSRMALVAGGSLVDDTQIVLDGNGRTIEGSPTLTVTAPVTPQQWFYRADLGDWKALTELALTDEFPFPEDLDDLFICALAIRLSGRYGKDVPAGTTACFADGLKRLKTRYRQAGTTIFGAQDIPNTNQSFFRPTSWMG